MNKPTRILLEATGLRLLYNLLRRSIVKARRTVAQRIQPLAISSEVIGPPKGRIDLKDYLQQKNLGYAMTIYEAPRLQPRQHFTSTDSSLQKCLSLQFEMAQPQKTYVATLPHARIYGPNGVVITDGDRVLTETQGSFWGISRQHPVFEKIKLPGVSHVPGRLAVVGYNYAHGYYHWMLEILPRFELLRRSGIPYDRVYMSPLLTGFQRDSLAILQFDQRRAIWATERTHVKADEVILPSLPGGHPGYIPRWVCDYLRDHFLPKEKVAQDQLLLISRRKAARRRILNEELLNKALFPLGFREVILEEHTIQEQARLFASAHTIVATHGAALTNLVFASPGAQVVELFGPSRTYNNFQVLSHLMGLKYHGLLTSPQGLSRSAIRKQDLFVDVPGIVRYLRTLFP